MSQNVVESILRKVPISTTKVNGYGIGLGQMYYTLESYNGSVVSVKSALGAGTVITIDFPQREQPEWLADAIVFHHGDAVVFLDDDKTVRSLWENLLQKYRDSLTLHFFTDTKKFLDFLEAFCMDDHCLLVDYDLRGDITGLQVILERGIGKDRAVIVTSIHHNKMMQDMVVSSGLKILPKQLLPYVPVIIEGQKQEKIAVLAMGNKKTRR
jgi:hypothetical protein